MAYGSAGVQSGLNSSLIKDHSSYHQIKGYGRTGLVQQQFSYFLNYMKIIFNTKVHFSWATMIIRFVIFTKKINNKYSHCTWEYYAYPWPWDAHRCIDSRVAYLSGTLKTNLKLLTIRTLGFVKHLGNYQTHKRKDFHYSSWNTWTWEKTKNLKFRDYGTLKISA